MTNLLDLPQDLLAIVFSHLGSEWTPSTRALYVSHPIIRNSEAINAQIQFARVHVHARASAVQQLLAWPARAQSPRKLILHAWRCWRLAEPLKDHGAILASCLRHARTSARAAQLISNVSEVELRGWRLAEHDAITVALLLSDMCPRLHHLSLFECRLSIAPLRVHVLASRLTSLVIDGSTTMDSRSNGYQLYGGDAIIRGIAARLPQLQHLSLAFTDYRTLSFDEFGETPSLNIAPLGGLTSLRSLRVGAFDRVSAKHKIRRPGVVYGMAEVLSGCPHLIRLSLGQATLQLQAFPSMLGPLPLSPSLRELHLPAVSLHDLMCILHATPALHTLELGRMEIPEAPSRCVIDALEDMLRRMHVLPAGPTYHLCLSYHPMSGRVGGPLRPASPLTPTIPPPPRPTPDQQRIAAAPLLAALAPYDACLHRLTLHRIVLRPRDACALASSLPGLMSLSLVRCDLRCAQHHHDITQHHLSSQRHHASQHHVFRALLPPLLRLRTLRLQMGRLDPSDFVGGLEDADRTRGASSRASAAAPGAASEAVNLCVEVCGIDVRGWFTGSPLQSAGSCVEVHEVCVDAGDPHSDGYELGDWEPSWSQPCVREVDEMGLADDDEEDDELVKFQELEQLLRCGGEGEGAQASSDASYDISDQSDSDFSRKSSDDGDLCSSVQA